MLIKYKHKIDIISIFYLTDEITKNIEIANGTRYGKGRPSNLKTSEIITLGIYRYIMGINNWKYFYMTIKRDFIDYFPDLPDYNNFLVQLKKNTIIILKILMLCMRIYKEKEGIFIIDCTQMKVCKKSRGNRHKSFKEYAKWSKTTTGYWFGFKLGLIIDDKGNIVNFKLTEASKHDLKVGKDLVKGLRGILIGDKGFVSKEWSEELIEEGLLTIISPKKNMKKVSTKAHISLLELRQKIEGVLSVLKRFYNLESTLYRSVEGYINHILLVLLSYQLNKYFSNIS